MSSLAIASIVFVCILFGTLVGIFAGRALPAHHLSGDSKDSVKQGLALISTLTALVLGLLVATTKGTYDVQNAAVKELAANAAFLDRILTKYGPEAKEARTALADVVKVLLDQTWPEDSGQSANLTAAEVRMSGDVLFDKLSALQAKTDVQQMLKSRALEIAISLAQTRQRLLAQKESSIPLPFLVVLGFWLTVLFTCFGLLAPRNATVVVILTVCIISVSGAVFLVLEMDKPFDGIMRISGAPVREAYSRLGG